MTTKKAFLSNFKSPFKEFPFGRLESLNNRFSSEKNKELSEFSIYYSNQEDKNYIEQSCKLEYFRSPGHYLDFKQSSYNIAYSPFQNKTEKFGKLGGKEKITSDNNHVNKATCKREKEKTKISEFGFQEIFCQRILNSGRDVRNIEPRLIKDCTYEKKEAFEPKELIMKISEQIDVLGMRLEDIDVNIEPEWDDEIKSTESEYNSYQSVNESFKRLKRKKKEELKFFDDDSNTKLPVSPQKSPEIVQINLLDESEKPKTGFSLKYLTKFYEKLVKLSSKVEKISLYNLKAGKIGIAQQLAGIEFEVKLEELPSEKKRRYFCKYCSKIFPSGSGLGGHMSRVHKGISKDFQRRKMTRDRRVIARERKSFLQKNKK